MEQNQTPEASDKQYEDILGFNANLESGAIKKGMAQAGAKSDDLWMVPIENIRILPNFNGRLDSKAYEEHINYLFNSIMVNGFYKDRPLTGFVAVDPDNSQTQVIYLTDGHSRYRAAQKAIEAGKELGPLPMTVKPRTHSMADLTTASYHANNGTKAYTTLEIALLCARMKEQFGLETFQIAERFNLTKPYVETLLTLARAPKAVRDLVQSGQVSASVAIETLRKQKENTEKVLTTAVAKATERAEASTARKPTPAPTVVQPVKEAVVGGVKPAATAEPTGSVATPKPEPQPSKAVVVKIKKADINPEEKLLAEQQRLAPRLFAEVQRLEKAGAINLTPELEKILFLVENVNGAPAQS